MKETNIKGINTDDLPDLVAGAKVVSASPLDDFVKAVLGEQKPVDTATENEHLT